MTSVVQTDEGSFIPASQRPDGTWRKARRVKDGYVPQEEVPLYESKGKQWAANKPTVPVGFDPVIIQQTEALKLSQQVKAKKKKKKKEAPPPPPAFIIEEPAAPVRPSKHQETRVESHPQPVVESLQTDPAKKLRNLKKKIREIEALEVKIASNSIKAEKEQLDKVSKKQQILDEIELLEQQVQHD